MKQQLIAVMALLCGAAAGADAVMPKLDDAGRLEILAAECVALAQKTPANDDERGRLAGDIAALDREIKRVGGHGCKPASGGAGVLAVPPAGKKKRRYDLFGEL